MGRWVHIVLVLCNNTVEIDSVWWNRKKARKRKLDIFDKSDGSAIVISKRVNTKALLKPEQYTNERVAREKVLDIPVIVDSSGGEADRMVEIRHCSQCGNVYASIVADNCRNVLGLESLYYPERKGLCNICGGKKALRERAERERANGIR